MVWALSALLVLCGTVTSDLRYIAVDDNTIWSLLRQGIVFVISHHWTRWWIGAAKDKACSQSCVFNSLRSRQNGRLFADDTFKRIFLNENIRISTKNSLNFVPKGLINNIPALVLIMAWRRPGDKPLSEPMMIRLPTHICVTRPQWVNVWHYCAWWLVACKRQIIFIFHVFNTTRPGGAYICVTDLGHHWFR